MHIVLCIVAKEGPGDGTASYKDCIYQLNFETCCMCQGM